MNDIRDFLREKRERDEVQSILSRCSAILEERGKQYGSWKDTFEFFLNNNYLFKFEKVNTLINMKYMRLRALRSILYVKPGSRETIEEALDNSLDAINYLGMAASVLVAELKERDDAKSEE